MATTPLMGVLQVYLGGLAKAVTQPWFQPRSPLFAKQRNLIRPGRRTTHTCLRQPDLPAHLAGLKISRLCNAPLLSFQAPFR